MNSDNCVGSFKLKIEVIIKGGPSKLMEGLGPPPSLLISNPYLAPHNRLAWPDQLNIMLIRMCTTCLFKNIMASGTNEISL